MSNKMMSNKNEITYSDGPIEEIRLVDDFLPSPEELVLYDETVKITIALSKTSIDFFKQQAQEHHVPYQRMIRRLLDEYVRGYAGTAPT